MKQLDADIERLIEEMGGETKQEEVNEKNKKIKETKKEIKLEKATLSKVQKDKKDKAEITACYPYKNKNGEIKFAIHRMKNADEPFYTVRPVENGAYKIGLGKEKPIPYNLPNVIEARDKGNVILVTEGESKADSLNELGYVATTAPFTGPDKWNSRYNRYVKRANILIIADNDDKGREFAECTFDTISDVANNIGILELSSIYSELKEGGGIEDLRNAVNDDKKLKTVLDNIIEEFMSDEKE